VSDTNKQWNKKDFQAHVAQRQKEQAEPIDERLRYHVRSYRGRSGVSFSANWKSIGIGILLLCALTLIGVILEQFGLLEDDFNLPERFRFCDSYPECFDQLKRPAQ